jgi:hypothetical protein
VKPQHIVATCLRLLAVFWLLYALSRANSTLGLARSDMGITVNVTAVWILALAQIAACAALWFFPMTIAARLIPGGARAEEPAAPAQLADWQSLGMICVGLWGLLDAIPGLVYWISFVTLSHNEDSLYDGLTFQQKATIAARVVGLLLSLWLVFGAKGFAAMLFRIRTAGVSKSASGQS